MKKILILTLLNIVVLTGCATTTQITLQTTQGTTVEEVNDCGEPKKNEWSIVWCDEFDYLGLPDNTKWSYDIGGHGWGNDELQLYTNREENIFVKDGHLTISANKENIPGTSNEYTSARIVSKGKGDFLYGRIEIKAKVPDARGTWSALWMLPTDNEYGSWPNSGEIDIMEYVGYNTGIIHGTIHTAKYNHKLGTSIGGSTRVLDATEAFHVYSIEWYPREMLFFVDENLYKIVNFNEELDGGSDYYKAWPFDQRFHLIMNIAVGGNWGGVQGVDPNLTHEEMVIDYVRVYQRDFGRNDVTAPSVPQIKQDELFVSSELATIEWTPSTDNNFVKNYEIYANNELIGTNFSTKHEVKLSPDTDYEIRVIAVDFAGNKSAPVIVNIKTLPIPSVSGIVEADNYKEISDGVKLNTNNVLTGIKKNDYIIYSINALEAGEYSVKFRLSSMNSDNDLALYTVDNTGSTIEYYGMTNIPNTNGFNNFQTLTFNKFIYLEEGINYLKLIARGNSQSDILWLDYLELN
ncbi:MAG: glycoside hydrolase family 16 [Haloplasmataceae bacterium]|jgi:beta-glucanase (GH16 family)|nr:glycoside hydrolase family 16 [Haloplasmataceae bacterium]